MFCQASLLFAATLALSVAASPVKRAAGVSIPLAKRSSFTTSNGVFDLDSAIRQTVHTHNKHRQNLINLEHNKGREAFNKASDIVNSSSHTDGQPTSARELRSNL
jgi:cathepsin D